MNSEKDKISKSTPEENFDEIMNLVSELKVPTSKQSKEAVWENLMQSIEADTANQVKVVSLFSSKKVWYSIAATIIALVTIVSLTYRFSTTELTIPKGQTANLTLPDSSKVTLNSDSKIEYRRFGWLSNREIELDGEAYFSVKHGNRFTVNAQFNRKVIVTGTKFNVMARREQFEVKCFEGSVTVQTTISKSIPIIKGKSFTIDKSGETTSTISVDSIEVPTWIKGEYFFNNTPLNLVFDELSRQYNVDISIVGFNPSNKNYTGFFKRDKLQNALDLICIPMDITYTISADSTSVTIKK